VFSVLACALSIASAAPPSLVILQRGAGGALPINRTAGLEFSIDPGTLEPATYVLEWVTPTLEGDEILSRQPVPLAGGPASGWMYGAIPNQTLAGDMRLRLRDPNRGSILIETEVAPVGTRFTGESSDCILVVSDQPVGLEGFESSTPGRPPSWSLIETAVFAASGDDLPEHPAGLAPFSTIVWTGRTPPAPATRSAIRTWMESGGHFIISMPMDADPWLIGSAGAVWPDLLPVQATTVDTPLGDLSRIISPDPLAAPWDVSLPVTTFAQAAGHGPWKTMIDAPDGAPMAIARAVGLGRLTVIGFDIASPTLSSLTLEDDAVGPLPAPAVFWNPILARRGLAPTPRQMRLIAEQYPLPSARPSFHQIDLRGIQAMASPPSQSGGRGLLVVLWIAACWLMCGPWLWRFLGKTGRRRLAWPMFALISVVAAVIAWGIGAARAWQSVEGTHVSVLDGAAGTTTTRARSWMTLDVPGYSTHSISVTPDDTTLASISPWTDEEKIPIGHSDTRGLPAVQTDQARVPIQARSTAHLLKADRVAESAPIFQIAEPLRYTHDASGQPQLTGAIQNMLDAPLENISLLWVEARTMPQEGVPSPPDTPESSGRMPVQAWWTTANQIPAGGILRIEDLEDAPFESQMEELVASMKSQWSWRGNWVRDLMALSLFRFASPPIWFTRDSATNVEHVELHRLFGAELDLGAALGSPMLLVMGTINDSTTAVPIEFDGKPLSSIQGGTLIRWVAPLPDQPPIPAPPSSN